MTEVPITYCPTAAVAETTARIPEEDAFLLRQHHKEIKVHSDIYLFLRELKEEG